MDPGKGEVSVIVQELLNSSENYLVLFNDAWEESPPRIQRAFHDESGEEKLSVPSAYPIMQRILAYVHREWISLLSPGPDVKALYFKLQAFKLMSYESHCRRCTPRRLSQAV